MIQARRKVLNEAYCLEKNDKTLNAGLLLDCFLKAHEQGKNTANTLFDDIKEAGKHSHSVYEQAYKARKQRLEGEGLAVEFKTHGRLIIGLGNSSVLETGLTLNRLYGTPMIPGSALKGLCSHYVNALFPQQQEKPPEKDHEKDKALISEEHKQFLFGDMGSSGKVCFHDAWITPETLNDAFHCDVMTPHHQDYYSSKGTVPATDFDSPVPIPFLSVSGTFLVTLTLKKDTVAEAEILRWLEVTQTILQAALEDWGIGGKTSSGYGRLSPT